MKEFVSIASCSLNNWPRTILAQNPAFLIADACLAMRGSKFQLASFKKFHFFLNYRIAMFVSA